MANTIINGKLHKTELTFEPENAAMDIVDFAKLHGVNLHVIDYAEYEGGCEVEVAVLPEVDLGALLNAWDASHEILMD